MLPETHAKGRDPIAMRWGLSVLALIVSVWWVATTSGFPSTHAAVDGFFRNTIGLRSEDAARATNVVRKSFHVPAYALLAFCAWCALPRRRRRLALVLPIVLVVAIVDESVQAAQPARHGSWVDVILDLFGTGLGLLLARRFAPHAAEVASRD